MQDIELVRVLLLLSVSSVLLLSLAGGGACDGHEPVNRVMSVWAGEGRPTPHLACLVGFLSLENNNLWRINCSQAHNYRLSISKTMRKDLGWVKEKTEIVFGSQPDNSAWEGPVVSWVCATFPKSGTVTFDCVPENMAPHWFKTPIQGPAPGRHLRKPGCNGGVCYCNNHDFCNDRNNRAAGQNIHTKILSGMSVLVLLLCG